jgi:hypothetical protein
VILLRDDATRSHESFGTRACSGRVPARQPACAYAFPGVSTMLLDLFSEEKRNSMDSDRFWVTAPGGLACG